MDEFLKFMGSRDGVQQQSSQNIAGQCLAQPHSQGVIGKRTEE